MIEFEIVGYPLRLVIRVTDLTSERFLNSLMELPEIMLDIFWKVNAIMIWLERVWRVHHRIGGPLDRRSTSCTLDLLKFLHLILYVLLVIDELLLKKVDAPFLLDDFQLLFGSLEHQLRFPYFLKLLIVFFVDVNILS